MCWKQARVVATLNYRYRRVGEGRADHDGTLCEATADRDCGDLRCRDTSRIVAATLQPPCSGRGGGNSEIINARCAERPQQCTITF